MAAPRAFHPQDPAFPTLFTGLHVIISTAVRNRTKVERHGRGRGNGGRYGGDEGAGRGGRLDACARPLAVARAAGQRGGAP